MASLNGIYDEDAELPSEFEVFEAGVNPTQLVEGDIVATKAGDGKLYKYKAEIYDGDNKGRLLFGQINLQNKNATATKIGQSEFAAVRLVTGVPNPEDTADLNFKAFDAVVEIEPAKTVNGQTYKARNVINWAKTAKLFNGEDVKPAQTPANDNAEKPADKPKDAAKPATTKKGAWPKKAA